MFCAFFFFCDGLVVVVQDLEEHERGHLGKNLGIDETKANKVPLCTPTHHSLVFFFFFSSLFFLGGDGTGMGPSLGRDSGGQRECWVVLLFQGLDLDLSLFQFLP